MSYWCKYDEAEPNENHCAELLYVDDAEDSVYEDDPEWVSIVPTEPSE